MLIQAFTCVKRCIARKYLLSKHFWKGVFAFNYKVVGSYIIVVYLSEEYYNTRYYIKDVKQIYKAVVYIHVYYMTYYRINKT